MSTEVAQEAALAGRSPGHHAAHQSHISAVGACTRVVSAWIVRSRARKAMRELAKEGRLLRDIGLTRAQVLDEAYKPFWRR